MKYGWRPDTPDKRDFKLVLPRITLPAKFTIRRRMPPVYDQGNLGSCTAQAIAAAMQFNYRAQKQDPFHPSRLFIYYNERVIENTVDYDAGAEIRDGIKSVARLGACKEELWPYNIHRFTNKPSIVAYEEAETHQALKYQRVSQTLNGLKTCLASSFPIIFGFAVYESFESAKVAKTGTAPMPKSTERMLGGHAVVAVGYDDKTERFICRNSWGVAWGDRGYFTLPYAYLTDTDLSADFWVINLVED